MTMAMAILPVTMGGFCDIDTKGYPPEDSMIDKESDGYSFKLSEESEAL